MNKRQKARERLDALLTGLEDEVIRGEGALATDVTAMRAEFEELIVRHAGKGVKDKVAIAMERLGRWSGIGQAGLRRNAAPQVRMAFSDKRDLPKGGGSSRSRTASNSTKRGKKEDPSGGRSTDSNGNAG